MKSFKIIPFFSLLMIFIACNESEDALPDEVTGTATFTVSGAESGSFEYNEEVEFIYAISSVSGGEISTLEIYIGNYPTTPNALKISMVQQGNSTGFDEKTYTYEELASSSTSTSVSGLLSLFVTEDASYSISAETTAVNKITYTSISDTKIEGSFEVNLEENLSGTGEKVKITGTFEAVGEAVSL